MRETTPGPRRADAARRDLFWKRWPPGGDRTRAAAAGAAPQPARRRPASTSSSDAGGRGALRRQGALAAQARREPLLEPGDARRRRDGRARAADIEFLLLASDAEALLAENRLIKRHQPRFNIRLRDDKSYPYIAISMDEDFPRVYFTRERHRSQPHLLRAVLERQAHARDARRAQQGLPDPLLPGRGAGPALGLAVPGLPHQPLRRAVRRLRHARAVHARRSTASSRSCPGATRRSSATSSSA